ncbi:E3 ubiquitin-protein ligase RGLG3 [Silene latifolia]|uniref:E3 ubiquitin-protein ligase RGLG3 n=1 Tax=Silene latifolia TaxID=37657 RepID=UPI003D782DA1
MYSTHGHKGKQLPKFIADNFSSVDEVTAALREAGLESSNLILGIDFTKSNEWSGKYSFNRRSLHAVGSDPNPYEKAISIIGRTLSPFDDDNLIPCFGFGDVTTRDKNVFSFYPDHRPCNGFEEVLARYKEIIPYIKLSGPTSFAPVVDAAIEIVKESGGQYHVLVIIADGQVSRPPDLPSGKLSPQEQATVNSIVAASYYPLSIVLVGVGDGPWDAMQKFDDNIPQRAFDNFQFVNFTKIMSDSKPVSKKEAAFALAALMEIPLQYRATQQLEFNSKKDTSQRPKPLPPPREVIEHDNSVKLVEHTTSSSSVERDVPVEQTCPICLTNPKNMAFGCGHLTCTECGPTLSTCPLCRSPITTRVRLYT